MLHLYIYIITFISNNDRYGVRWQEATPSIWIISSNRFSAKNSKWKGEHFRGRTTPFVPRMLWGNPNCENLSQRRGKQTWKKMFRCVNSVSKCFWCIGTFGRRLPEVHRVSFVQGWDLLRRQLRILPALSCRAGVVPPLWSVGWIPDPKCCKISIKFLRVVVGHPITSWYSNYGSVTVSLVIGEPLRTCTYIAPCMHAGTRAK